MHLVHSEILPMASVAAARLGLVDVTTVDCCSGEFRDAILEEEGLAVTSRGYSLRREVTDNFQMYRSCYSARKQTNVALGGTLF